MARTEVAPAAGGATPAGYGPGRESVIGAINPSAAPLDG